MNAHPQTPAPAPRTPVEARGGGGVARPRNYLAGNERRRMFWLVMPPALVGMLVLGWLERTWFARSGPPPAAQVDTRLRDRAADAGPADQVIIELPPEPPPGDPDEYGAPVEALAQVRDDTMFRGAEQEAWFQTWLTLRSSDSRSLARAAVRRVGFSELYGQPRSYRGRLVRFRGTLRRLEKMEAPENAYDIRDYWQGWLEPEGGPVSPIVVYFLRLPAGMPHGMKIDEPVDVVGYFFKRWAYAATDTVRIAPLVLALEPIWKPRPADDGAARAVGTAALVTIGAVVLLTALGIRLAGRGPGRRPAPGPADLTAALADVAPFSTEESLRHLERAAHGPPDPGQEEARR